jgi:uncharacterized protein (DUF58 family)
MRLTRRGYAVLAVVVAGVALAAQFGPRSLNAIVLPAAVALVAALVQVYRAAPPSVERTVPANGFPGETNGVTLHLDADTSYLATVTDSLPYGVEGDARVDAVVGGDPVSYDVTYRTRGEHELGPVSVVAYDVLGLAKRELVGRGTDAVLVYPNVQQLTKSATQSLWSLHDPEWSSRRDEFDRLREYTHGDSLRDVHWKSSAKREGLVVKEFVAETDAESLHVSAGGARTAADEMADAAATVAVALSNGGIPVTLSTPSGAVDADPGAEDPLLEHLARASGGPVPDAAADVVVRASETATTIRLGDVETTFEELVRDDGLEAAMNASRSVDASGTLADEEVPA